MSKVIYEGKLGTVERLSSEYADIIHTPVEGPSSYSWDEFVAEVQVLLAAMLGARA